LPYLQVESKRGKKKGKSFSIDQGERKEIAVIAPHGSERNGEILGD